MTTFPECNLQQGIQAIGKDFDSSAILEREVGQRASTRWYRNTDRGRDRCGLHQGRGVVFGVFQSVAMGLFGVGGDHWVLLRDMGVASGLRVASAPVVLDARAGGGLGTGASSDVP